MVECDFVRAPFGTYRELIARGLWFPAAPRVGELVSLNDSIFRVVEVLWVPKGITACAVIYVEPF